MKSVTLTVKEFKLLMECAKSAISKDECRPLLTFMKIEVRKDHIAGVVCDGYRLENLVILHENAGEDFDCFIKPITLPKGLESVEIEKEGIRAHVRLIGKDSTQTLTYSFIQPSGEYIDYESFMPKVDRSLQITFNANLLRQVLKPFCKDKGTVRLSFVRKGDGIDRLTPMLMSDDSGLAAILLPLRS